MAKLKNNKVLKAMDNELKKWRNEKDTPLMFSEEECAVWRAWDLSVNNNLDEIEFSEVIWEDNIKGISETLVSANIKTFIITVRSTNNIDVIDKFQNLGWKIDKVVEITRRDGRWVNPIVETRKGIRMRRTK